jgi:hypothetical protein
MRQFNLRVVIEKGNQICKHFESKSFDANSEIVKSDRLRTSRMGWSFDKDRGVG